MELLGVKAVGSSSLVITALLLAPFAVLMAYTFVHPAEVASLPAASAPFLAGIYARVAMWNYMGWDNALDHRG